MPLAIRLWTVMTLNLWYERWINVPAASRETMAAAHAV